jgi:hypothetical protein
MRNLAKRIGIIAAIAAVPMSVSAPAMAHDGYYGGGPGYGYHHREYRGYDDGYHYRGGYVRSGYGRGYEGYRGYHPRYGYHGGRCRDNGVGGAVIGAVAGGLFGNAVAGRGNRTTGTVVGGAIGAVAGHAIDKSDGRPCY